MSEVKLREFWLIEDGVNNIQLGWTKKKPSGISGGGSNESTHVIEYSAYEKLQARLLEFEGMTFSENEEIKKLKSEVTALKKELEDVISMLPGDLE